MSAARLFRSEVADARKDAWMGQVLISQPLPVTLVAAASILLVCASIAYVGLGTYTRRVHASGIMLPSAGLITVASPSAGLISGEAAAEGDQVRKGELLFVVSLEATSSEGPAGRRVIEQLKGRKALFEKARDLLGATAELEKQALTDQLANLKSQRKLLAEQTATQDGIASSLKDRAEALQRGVKSGIVRDAEFQNQNFFYHQAVTLLAQYHEISLQLDGRISETTSKLAMFDAKLAQQINQVDRDILQLQQQLTETEAKRSIEIRAPEDGTLTSIRVHAGEQVAGGAALVTLLPRSGKLEANFFVDSSAIGFIEKSELVVLRYAAFPFQRFGLYRGFVAEVTRAPVASPSDDRAPSDAKRTTHDGLYRIVVDPEFAYVTANGERKPLEAGMRVEADIAIEKRRLYQWLFDPLHHLRRSVDFVTSWGVR
jgi:membrane fusion protein